MGASRALGALICVVTLVVAVLHIWYGYIGDLSNIGQVYNRPGLAFALPITVGLLAVCAVGFWLGWIMATTKEASPPPPVTEKKEEKKEEK
ncbi:MAG: hypothetical protein QW567_02030 [Candidatus Hadarchaeales archaeon]